MRANSKQVAHIWAQRNEAYVSNHGGSFYAEGDTIYSYGSHFPIARHINSNVVLYDGSYCSATTRKHQAYVLQAIPHDRIIIEVPNVLFDDKDSYAKDVHKQNLCHIVRHINELIEKEENARVNSYIDDIEDRIQQLTTYLETFNAKRYKTKEMERLINLDISEMGVRREEREERAKELKRKREKEREERDRVKRQQWKDGKNVSPGFSTNIDLRLKPNDHSVIETSLGAEVPLAEGLKLFTLYERVVRGKTEPKEVTGFKIGHFTVLKVRQNYDLVVGCHTLTRDTIENFVYGILDNISVEI